MKKRVLSMLLALVLCAGLLPMAVSAAVSNEEMIDKMSFDPGTPVLTDVTQTTFWPSDTTWVYNVSKDEIFSQIENLTYELVSGKSSDVEKAKAIHSWVAQNIKYDKESEKAIEGGYDGENVQQSGSAFCTFYRKMGVCGGYAQLVSLMDTIAGLPSAYITGNTNGGMRHAWSAVYAGGNWIFFDSTWNRWDMGPDYHLRTSEGRMNEVYIHGELQYVISRSVGEVSLISNNGYQIPRKLVIPSCVTKIHSAAFYENATLENLVLPASLESVSSGAFSKCPNLKSVTIEEGFHAKADSSLFDDCPNLTTINIPKSLTKTEKYMFSGCSGLTSYVIPDHITEIGNSTFNKCANLKSVTIPDSVTKIAPNAFTACTSLESIIIPDTVTEIGGNAFAWSGLKSIIIPDSVTALNSSLFESCENLESVTLSKNIKSIGSLAFIKCKSLKSIILPDGVTSIGLGAFADIPNLKIYIPSSVTEIGDNILIRSTNAVIYTEPGSYAETYAKENKIKVVTTGETPEPSENPTPTLTDSSKPSAWAQAEVTAATQAGLVPGDLLSSYTSAINREEFCRLMVKLIEAESGKDIASYVTSQGKEIFAPFTDTSAQEVKAAYALGIVNGVSATKFNPSGFITRQEAAAMLERTAKLLGLTSGTGVSFSDSDKIASWAADSVAFVSGLTDPTTGGRVMGGTGSGFSPLGTYTREQAIATALRLFHCAA